MSLRWLIQKNKSLIVRMTVWYTIIFAVSSFAVLSIFYFKIQAITIKRTDNMLIEEANEFSDLMQQGGRSKVLAELELESKEESVDEIFFRLLDIDGKEIKATDLSSWGDIEFTSGLLQSLTEERHILETLVLPAHPFKVRVINRLLGPAEILQIGVSLKDSQIYLNTFRNFLFRLMLPIFIFAMIVGWLIAKRSLAGMEEVTKTATEISNGFFDKRVNTENRPTEVQQLGLTFNKMVSQLQDIITATKDMTDNIAHDLRSPIARIRGIAEMTLLSKADVNDYEEMAVNTIEECDKLIDLINTMLDISEADAGIIELDMDHLNLKDLISEARDIYSMWIDEKNISVLVDVSDNLTLRSDRHKLQRIISNLLENSIKYTPENGQINVTAKRDGTMLSIVVMDSGEGISSGELPYIFNRFYRGDKSRSYSGVGLGLSLVKGFVAALGGHINVSSKVGKGSCFTVKLPT